VAGFWTDPIGKERMVECIKELKAAASVKFPSVCLRWRPGKKRGPRREILSPY
jgi:hypothetical protein